MNLSDLTNVLAIGMPGLSEMVIVLVVVLLLFGNRLPGAMKSLGQSLTAFKKGIKEGEEDQGDDRNIGQK